MTRSVQEGRDAAAYHDPHRPSPGSIRSMLASMHRNRSLVMRMARQEVLGRYKGSVMGLAWSFLNPLFMLAIYTFVFSAVFKARWGLQDESKIDFALILFVGLILHGIFAECMMRAPTLIISNVNYVKKVVFPLETLPMVVLCSALFHGAISMLVLHGALLVSGNALHFTSLLCPILILPTGLAALGVGWFLASLGVYLRDIGQLASILAMALLFMSPVFFPMSAMPEKYQFVMSLNPLTIAIEQMRMAVIWGEVPDWRRYAVQLLIGLILSWCGYWWFQRTRKGFADVL